MGGEPVRSAACVLLCAIGIWTSVPGSAQTSTSPYKVNYNWDKLQGRKIGVASGIRLDPDGKHLWILDRCGANGCAESDLDPIIEVDLDGKLIKSFGKGLISFPHGFFIEPNGDIWVTDGAPAGDPRGEAGFKKRMGHQVFKFSPDGKVLMKIGTAGEIGRASCRERVE